MLPPACMEERQASSFSVRIGAAALTKYRSTTGGGECRVPCFGGSGLLLVLVFVIRMRGRKNLLQKKTHAHKNKNVHMHSAPNIRTNQAASTFAALNVYCEYSRPQPQTATTRASASTRTNINEKGQHAGINRVSSLRDKHHAISLYSTRYGFSSSTRTRGGKQSRKRR